MTPARFAIVVPTFQADGWLDETLNSIFGQAGRHQVRLHLQDGGSTDATLQIAERWQALTTGAASPFAGRVEMTIDSERDNGLYDAVQRGFETLDPEPGEIMTWLNADDLLAPGALQSVASCLQELPQVSLCGGRVSMIDADGRVVRVNAPVALSQKLLAAGCYDGRKMPFVMQEGTFWRQELWSRVGGLDPSFRLAGDWDLWRRMARHAEFVTLDVLTAFHRRRPGQLSENLDAYYSEVDRRLTGAARDAYDRVYLDYVASGTRSGGQAFEGFEGPVAQLDRDSLLWSMTHRFGERLAPAVVQTPSGRQTTLRGGVLSGAKGFEGPYPEWDLPGGIRWITERHARLSVPTSGPGRHAVCLTCRAGASDLSVVVRARGEVLLHAVIDPLTPVRDQVLHFDLWTTGGETVLDLETTTPYGDPENRLLVVDLTAVARPVADLVQGEGEGPHVLVAADDRPQGLAATLASLAAQRPLPRVTVAAPDVHALQEVVIGTYRPMIHRRIIGDEAAVSSLPGGPSERPVMALEAGTALAPGSLTARLGKSGAAREIDGRGVAWIRPAATFDAGLATAVPAASTTDTPLIQGAPGNSTEAGPRILRLIEAADARADALGRVLAGMDADIRTLTLPEEGRATLISAELKAWRPVLVLGRSEALSSLPALAPATIKDTKALRDAAEAAAARLDLDGRAPAPARAIFGLSPFDAVWAVAARDVNAARAAAGDDVTLLVLGEGPVSSGEGLVFTGALEGSGVIDWVLSAADCLWASASTSPALIRAAQACGLLVLGSGGEVPAPLDVFARAMMAAATPEARPALRRALRFRPGMPPGFGLFAGPGAVAVEDALEVTGPGAFYLVAPVEGPVRIRLTAVDDGVREVRLWGPPVDEVVALENGRAVLALEAGEHPRLIRIEPTGGAVRIALVDGRSGGMDLAVHSTAWEPQQGFGREEAPAPDLGLDAPFRWIEGRRARLALLNTRAGWRRLTLRLRSLSPDQRVMVRAAGRTLVEAPVEGGDPRHVVRIEAVAELPEGWIEADLRFLAAAVMPDRTLAAIVDGVELTDAQPLEDVPVTGWRDVDGFDFEEPPAPQYGLENRFRWRLAGARIAVTGERPGKHHIVIRYRTALPGQTLSASVDGKVLAHNKADAGRLDMDERLSFDLNLTGSPVEIAFDADRYMEGDRPLGFIIQSVSVEPTL